PELETPSYDDHAFVNWYLDEAFTEIFNQNDPLTKDVTIYARWLQSSPPDWFVVSNGVLVQCTPPDNTDVVVIPEGVTTIPDWFVLANGLNEPGKPGFPTGKNIKEFILPQSLETIGKGAFKYAAITQIQIPAGVRQLEPVTFDGCDQLVSFTFAEGSQLERLAGNDGNEAVITASRLKEISFPPSLQFVGKYTLAGCQALLTVTFERSESPVIFDSYLPGGGVWLFGGYFPNKIRVPNEVSNAFISEMRKVMQDYEFNNMSSIVEGY
ncbi:MAG TPA: leucine-rich repeat protein, partial [Agriterribacter sp.]|nr:leucine-rich repeat protein [Agriterribacter sp.]